MKASFVKEPASRFKMGYGWLEEWAIAWQPIQQ
jgi:hypothetical protein